jgi:predicted metal-dependent hydrolase
MEGQQRLFDDGGAAPLRRVTTGPASRAGSPAGPSSAPSGPEVEIRISKRRRKSATAYWSDGRIVVLLPSHLRGSERTEMVDWLVARVISRRPRTTESDRALFDRALLLGRRYVPGAEPTVVRWVTNQHKRWASCTAETGEIRLSHRLKAAPGWVIDAVLVHELAHLVHPDHSSRFYDLADRFPRQEDAALFLEGFALGLDAQDGQPGALE